MQTLIRLLTIKGLQKNLYTLRGSNYTIFIFASLLNKGQLLKERICSKGSKFFPLKVDLILHRLYHPGKETGCHKVVSLCKNDRKSGSVPTHFKIYITEKRTSCSCTKLLKLKIQIYTMITEHILTGSTTLRWDLR